MSIACFEAQADKYLSELEPPRANRSNVVRRGADTPVGELLIELGKRQVRPGLGEGLSTGFTDQVGLIAEIGKKALSSF